MHTTQTIQTQCFERSKTVHALDHAATVIGDILKWKRKYEMIEQFKNACTSVLVRQDSTFEGEGRCEVDS
jgi:hypothetical protein